MTLRMKLARWIGGKELEADEDGRMQAKMFAMRSSFDDESRDGQVAFIEVLSGGAGRAYRLVRCKQALEAIAALETPKANATVRNMARIAREAMK